MNVGVPKWQMPGWRIEQKYSTGVLIGNWSEDRLGKVYMVIAQTLSKHYCVLMYNNYTVGYISCEYKNKAICLYSIASLTATIGVCVYTRFTIQFSAFCVLVNCSPVVTDSDSKRTEQM